MDTDILLSVLKWTGVIIVTGFIAQFGKKFADFLIDRARKNKRTDASAVPPGRIESAAGAEPRKEQAKALKKLKKTETKIRKKAGD